MAMYHCAGVGKALQRVPGITVTGIESSYWQFEYKGASAKIRILPGCCGILLLHNFSGPAKDILRLSDRVVKAATVGSFGIVLCSVQVKSPLCALLKTKRGWLVGSAFKNPRTKNDLEVLYKAVKPPKEKRVVASRHGDD